MLIKKPIPILRSFSQDKAVHFYIDFLGFKIDWQHRFEENTPLYMQLSFGDCVLHLSEHHGDSCPGAALRIGVDDLEEYQKILLAKHYANARPSIQEMPWGTRDMSITDPFGNKLIFTDQINP